MRARTLRKISCWIGIVAAACARVATLVVVAFLAFAISPSRAAQPAAADTLFGIQLGVALDKQFGECPRNEKGEYGFGYHSGSTPCWKEGTYGKDVVLPSRVLKDTSAYIESSPRVRTRDGLVVEIDVDAHRDTWRQAESYMLRHYGKPEKTETYERDSRVSGLSRHRAHTWRGNGATLYFIERASSDNARIRAVNDAWAKASATER